MYFVFQKGFPGPDGQNGINGNPGSPVSIHYEWIENIKTLPSLCKQID